MGYGFCFVKECANLPHHSSQAKMISLPKDPNKLGEEKEKDGRHILLKGEPTAFPYDVP